MATLVPHSATRKGKLSLKVGNKRFIAVFYNSGNNLPGKAAHSPKKRKVVIQNTITKKNKPKTFQASAAFSTETREAEGRKDTWTEQFGTTENMTWCTPRVCKQTMVSTGGSFCPLSLPDGRSLFRPTHLKRGYGKKKKFNG